MNDDVKPTILTDPREWVESMLGRVVINLITSWPKEVQDAYWDKKHSQEKPVPVVVTVTIDGIPTDFRNFCKVLEDQHRRMLIEQAEELLKEQVGDLHYRVSEAVDQLVDGLKHKAIELLGYDPEKHG